MGLIVKKEKGFDPVPAGVHQGVCYAVYDLGTQHNKVFDKYSHQALIIWEIPSERIEIQKDGQTMSLPRVVSKTYTLSFDDRANFKKDLISWRGREFSEEEQQGFDISRLVGVNGMLNIIHVSKDGKTYGNLSAILPLYKGISKVEPENPTVVYSMEQGEPPEGTPKWIVEKIHDSVEWKQAHNPVQDEHPPYDSGDNPDVPF
jgi:hypothetical protein